MVNRNTGKKMNVNETKRLSELEIKKLFSCLRTILLFICRHVFTREILESMPLPERRPAAGLADAPGGTLFAGISGNTALNNALAPYISKIPLDPKAPRSVGDAYIYFQGNADINCYEATRESGAWIVWEPDRLFYTNDRDDSFCGLNSRTACCSALGCSANSFCVFKMN